MCLQRLSGICTALFVAHAPYRYMCHISFDLISYTNSSHLYKQCNFIAACIYFGGAYLDILASLIIMVTSACMLTITMQQPEQFMVYLEMTGKEIVFTWRMRMLADIIQILFLISCGLFGQIMAILTGVMLFVAFTLAQKRPDIFRELFRKHAGDPAVGDESVGDGTEDTGYRETSEDSARV